MHVHLDKNISKSHIISTKQYSVRKDSQNRYLQFWLPFCIIFDNIRISQIKSLPNSD